MDTLKTGVYNNKCYVNSDSILTLCIQYKMSITISRVVVTTGGKLVRIRKGADLKQIKVKRYIDIGDVHCII